MSSLTPHGPTLWRSLAHALDDPALVERARLEFPGLTRAFEGSLDRRKAMRLMGAALAMAGASGCASDAGFGQLIPAVRIPPDIVPGLPNVYATANVVDGYASGILVRHNMARPTKVEGNPEHPASLGATDVFAQASVLDFYDPDRALQITGKGIPSDARQLDFALAAQRTAFSANRGAGLRILTGRVTSPTTAAALDALLTAYPEARWRQWNSISRDRVSRGANLAYGVDVDMVFMPNAADVLVAIDSDLVAAAPGHLRYARDYASRRNPARNAAMSRIYAIEASPTLIGAGADHRFIVAPDDIPAIVSAIAADVLGRASHGDRPGWVAPLVADLKAARGRALVHVGPDQPAELHALVHAINEALGARDKTFALIEPVAHRSAQQGGSLRDLVAEMSAGQVSSLYLLDVNPVYAAAADLGFAEALKRVPFSLSLAQRADETARATTWFAPMLHEWETWSDARAYDGTATILQPQALPLHGGTSVRNLLSRLISAEPEDDLHALQAAWRGRWSGDFDKQWREALSTGVIAGSPSPKSSARLAPNAGAIELASPAKAPLRVLFRPSPTLWDGRFANNAWLQELPHPLTKTVWDNPLLIAPQTAVRLKLDDGDKVRLTIGARSVTTPVWIMPGQSPACVIASLGYGRRNAGLVGDGVGVDFHPLVGLEGEARIEKEAGRAEIATTVHHNLLMETPREILRHGSLEEFRANPRFAANEAPAPHLYKREPPGPAAWAMSIDLNACIGCNACVVACQAENNIPVVGRDEVLREREMHWLRIDRYFEGAADAPESFFQPVLCMHCEEAPCELVCPVGATVHDSEGLNVMVYNRCVGTRFCSNNCPYKVRRFNYFDFADQQRRPPQSWNPDVTVRARGVMEKCTYCIQRIAEARIAADRDGKPVGEVVTACQAACPTQAFSFGNLADPQSEVARRKQSPLDFAMLESQNTRPRTTYEAVVRNRNPDIKAQAT